jgi:hypothetical protein
MRFLIVVRRLTHRALVRLDRERACCGDNVVLACQEARDASLWRLGRHDLMTRQPWLAAVALPLSVRPLFAGITAVPCSTVSQ